MTDPHDVGEDGFHEIQLSGKQLVFLFMATTVVSVVIFLCGVLVGRSVRGDTLNAADRVVSLPPVVSGVADPPASPAGGAQPADVTYTRRLEAEAPVKEDLKADSRVAAPEARPPDAKSTPPAPEPTPPAPSAASGARPGTWAVQVVALSDRAAADAVVQRLAGKGYPVFLVSPQPGGANRNFKVQVGRYSDRTEAEQIATRLKREEQFEPWILR